MTFVRKALFFALWTGFVVLSHYELTAKSASWSRPLPGWNEARLVERDVAFRPLTRIPVLDAVLHETQEARLFYARLLA